MRLRIQLGSKINDDGIIYTIVIHLVLLACKNMLVSTNAFIFEYNDLLNNIIMVVLAILYLRCILFCGLLKKIPTLAYMFLILVIVFVVLTFFIDPNRFLGSGFPYNYVRSQLRTFIAYCLPLFLAVSSIKDYEGLSKKLFSAVPKLFFVALLAFLLRFVSKVDNADYSMSYGNAVMFLTILAIFRYVTTKKKTNIIYVIISLGFIISCGSRGPLVSIFLAIIICLVCYSNSRISKLTLFFMPIISMLIWFCFDNIIVLATIFLEGFGIRSRTLILFTNGMGTYDSGRTVFHQGVLNKLSEKPLTGLGAFGGEATVGLTHSLYLDTLANFGYVIGIPLLVLLIGYSIKLFMKNKNGARGYILIVFMVEVFPTGFFNGGFWESKELWMIIGIICSSLNDYFLSNGKSTKLKKVIEHN